jgi:hypothetical protein
MPTILQDPVLPDPSLSVRTPLSPADPLSRDLRESLGQSSSEYAGDVASFDLESPGGYAHRDGDGRVPRQGSGDLHGSRTQRRTHARASARHQGNARNRLIARRRLT